MPPVSDLFRPTRERWLAAIAIAGVSFLLPQKVPLVWYPLNDPGTDGHYLEIVCSSDKKGTIRVFYDTTRGFNDLESLQWPVTPTTQAITYTFPLPDAPITALRLDPVGDGGALTIRELRIINRRGELIRRFSREMFRALSQITAISSAGDGWIVTSTPGSPNPSARIDLPSPLIPVGMNARNLQRCLLSTGYLALMLWILLLALLLVLHRAKSGAELAPRLAFTVGLALLFALVGNRGLIRNSLHYARYHPPVLASAERIQPKTGQPDSSKSGRQLVLTVTTGTATRAR